ncbi:MAG TPA: RNA-binding protein [Bacteroidia bacterium]|nr:RNA-binding protein [Bacteroidia bacterium]
MNIFVSNLSFKVDEESLKQLFQNYGEVTSCKIVTDKFTGRSRGFGFVEMKSEEDGQKAIDGLNETEHDGRSISVSIAKPRTETGNRNSGGGDRRGGNGGGNGGGSGNYNKRW